MFAATNTWCLKFFKAYVFYLINITQDKILNYCINQKHLVMLEQIFYIVFKIIK